MRREFQLPGSDEEFLNTLGRPWEAIVESGRWLLLHEWPVPLGYNHTAVSAAVLIEQGYPDAQLDMVYFHPHLTRADGRGINALAGHRLDGKEWQRWSRHRTAANPWRAGVDDISCHLMLVDDWLVREFEARAA